MPAEGTGSPRAGTAAGRRPAALPDRMPGNTPRWHPRVARSWDSIERLPFGRETGGQSWNIFLPMGRQGLETPPERVEVSARL